MPGDLHGGGAHAAGGPVDEHLLAGLQVAAAEEVQGRGAAEGEAGGFLESQPFGL
jgi:hypothetical protein